MWHGFEPGDVFARDYRVVDHLASGGMGMVYLVDQISTGKPRALKVMHPHYARDPALRARFEKEARVASLIESDHVVEVIGAGVDEKAGIPWLAMELLRGSTLDGIVRDQGPLTLIAALEVAKQLHHALDQAHKKSLIHRDLKPENIFLAKPRRPDIPFNLKILDFGIAKWVQEAKDNMKNSEVIGTPFWMAPEQLDTEMAITPATDVWAVGLIMFWVLTGRMYWRRGNEAEPSVSAILKEMILGSMPPASVRLREIDPSLSLPDGFDAWFERAVNRDMDHRYPEGGEALAAMVKLLSAAEAKERSPAQASPPIAESPSAMAVPSFAVVSHSSSRQPSARITKSGLGSGSVRLREDRVWDALVIALEEEIAAGDLPPDEVRLRWLEIGHIREHELGDPDGSALAYKRAAEVSAKLPNKTPPRAEAGPSLRSPFPRATTPGGMFVKAQEAPSPAQVMPVAPGMFTKPSAGGSSPGSEPPPQHQRSPGMFTPVTPAQPATPPSPAKPPSPSPSQPGQPAPSPSSFRSARSPMFAPADPSPPQAPPPAPSTPGTPATPAAPQAPLARSPFPRLDRPLGTLRFNPAIVQASPIESAAPGAAPAPIANEAPAAPQAAPPRVAISAPVAASPELTVDQLRQLILAAPRRPEGWIGLFDFYRRAGDIDATWCVAHTASTVIANDLPDVVRAFHIDHAPALPQATLPPMSDAQLQLLWDPELDRGLSGALGLLVPALSALREVKLSDLGITEAQLINPASPSSDERSAATGHGVSALLAAGTAFHVPSLPSLYYRNEGPPGFKHTRAIPRASLVGGASRRAWRLESIRYAAGEHMALYRAELYARVLAPREGELEDAIAAARTIIARTPRASLTPLAQALAARLTVADLASLEEALSKPGEVNMALYRRDVDRTAARAGFLLCRDFAAARDALRDIEPLPSAPTAVERLRTVLLFSISEAYFTLRKQLGLALKS